jgi:hypothetical protein
MRRDFDAELVRRFCRQVGVCCALCHRNKGLPTGFSPKADTTLAETQCDWNLGKLATASFIVTNSPAFIGRLLDFASL